MEETITQEITTQDETVSKKQKIKKKFPKFKRRKKWIIIAVIVVFVILMIANLNSKQTLENIYEFYTAKTGDISTYYSFSGKIAADDKQIILAETNYKIKNIAVEEGDQVKTGDLLYTIDNAATDAQLAQAAAALKTAKVAYQTVKDVTVPQQITSAKNALSSAKIAYDNAVFNLNGMEALWQVGGISQVEYTQAKDAVTNAKLQYDAAKENYDLLTGKQANLSVEQAEASVEQAQAAYDLIKSQMVETNVIAKIDGVVNKINFKKDELIPMGSTVMDVVSLDKFIATINIDEYDMSSISLNKEVDVSIDGLEKTVKGIITNVSSSSISTNGISYFTAEISINNEKGLYDGMSIETKVLNKQVKDVISIPMKALEFDSTNMAYVNALDKDGNISKKFVTVGINDGIMVEIKKGINKGDTVLIPKTEEFDYQKMMESMGG